MLPRTRALLRFLVQRGEHVRSLQLDIRGPNDWPESDRHELLGLLPACLAARAVQRPAQPGSGLSCLSISAETPLLCTSCLPPLTGMEELCLPGRDSSLKLRLGNSWRRLTALRSAHLSGQLLCTDDGPGLLPSLTRLCIEGDLNATESELDGRVSWLRFESREVYYLIAERRLARQCVSQLA